MRSIKSRVTLSTLVIVAISVWGLSFYVSGLLRDDMQRLLGEQQFATVSFVAAEINDELTDRLTALELIAKQIDGHLIGQPAALQALLEQQPILQVMFNGGIFVTGTDGTAIADVPLSNGRIGTNYIDRESVSVPLKEGKTVIGRPAMGKKLGAPIFSMVVPLRDATGKVIGTLVATINLGKPSFLDKVTQGHYGKTGGFLLMAPQHALLITASDKSRIMQPLPAPGLNAMHDRYMQGYEGFGVTVSSRGVEELTAAKAIPAAGWRVGLVVPTAEAFAPVHNLQQRMLWATLLMTLLVGGLIWWALRHLLAPLLATAETLSRLTQSSPSLQPLPIQRDDEIGTLIGGFNRLLETLHQRQEALRQSEARLIEAQRMGHTGHWHLDLATNHVVWSQELYLMLGLDPNAPPPDYTEHARLFTPESWTRLSSASAHTQESGAAYDLELELVKPHGEHGWMRSRAEALRDARGAIVALQGTAVDITLGKQATQLLQQQQQRLSNILWGTGAGTWEWQVQTGETRFNERWAEIVGYRLEELAPVSIDTWMGLAHPDDLARSADLLARHFAGQIDSYVCEARMRHKDGHWVWVLDRGKLVSRTPDGQPEWMAGTHSDITERKGMEAEVHRLAFHDLLTGLPNRRLLLDRLSQLMATSKRSTRHAAMMVLDLDNFKSLNDKHGHPTGDLLLIEVAVRLQRCVRAMDTVARFGGDEFAVLLADLDLDRARSTAQAQVVAEKIRASLAQPYRLTVTQHDQSDRIVEHECSASLGVVVFVNHSASQIDVLSWADAAMYRAKNAGRNAIRFHDGAAGQA